MALLLLPPPWERFRVKGAGNGSKAALGEEEESGKAHGSGRWAAPSSRGTNLLIALGAAGRVPRPHVSHHVGSIVPIPRKGCTRRSRKGLTAGELRTKQGAACVVSHPPFVSYSDPTSSETENIPYEDFRYLG